MPRFGGSASRGFGASGGFPGGRGSAVAILDYAAQERIVAQYLYEHAGVPTDGTNGTYAHVALPGALLIDTDNKTLYQNTGTQASPTWTERSAASGGGSGLQYVDAQFTHEQITHQVGTRATAALTVAAQPSAGDTITIGAQTWTFVADGTASADGQINVGTNLATAKTAIHDALDADDGYSVGVSLSVSVGAFIGNVLTITGSLNAGASLNGVATTASFSSGANHWGAAAFAGGVNNAPLLLKAAPGAGLALLPRLLYVVVDTSAGAYTPDGENVFELGYLGETTTDGFAALTTGGTLVGLSDSLSASALMSRVEPPLPGLISTAPLIEDRALGLFCAGNYTDGHPDNTVSVRFWYSTVPALAFGA